MLYLDRDGRLRKFSAAGTPLWSVRDGGVNKRAVGMVTSGDTAIFRFGYHNYNSPDKGRMLRLDTAGNVVWEYDYVHTGLGHPAIYEDVRITAATVSSTGELYIAGWMSRWPFLAKIDPNTGARIWERNIYNNDLLEDPKAIATLNNGNIAMFSFGSYSTNPDINALSIFDPNGNLVSMRNLYTGIDWPPEEGFMDAHPAGGISTLLAHFDPASLITTDAMGAGACSEPWTDFDIFNNLGDTASPTHYVQPNSLGSITTNTVTTVAENHTDSLPCSGYNQCHPLEVLAGTSTSGPVVDFTFIGSHNSGATFLWNFGDGSTSTLENPQHTYSNTGLQTITLVVQDSCYIDSTTTFAFITSLDTPCTPPEADFSYSISGSTVTFSNTSTAGTGASYTWIFGDSTTSSQPNPIHTYTTTGLYYVALFVSDSCSDDLYCIPIQVGCGTTQAAFTASSTMLSASFTNTSATTGSATYNWNFGDGSTSTAQSPSHTYAQDGSYTVCLTVTDSCSTDSTCQTVVIGTSSCPSPTAAFSVTTNDLTATFSGSATGTGSLAYLWDFGDNISSTAQSPSHTYAVAGTYNACLTVTDSCGSTTSCQSVTVTCPGVTPSFTYQITGTSVQFWGNATGGGSYQWTFGNGASVSAQNPIHQYASFGTYTVCLSVTNSCGTDSVCQVVDVSCPPPTAGYTWTANDLQGVFNNTTTNGSSYSWDFGDGFSGSGPQQAHWYNWSGDYVVCLTASNSCGSNSFCDTIEVCTPPTADFTWDTMGAQATFTNTSDQQTTQLWSFGNDSSSTELDPTQVYAASGSYWVCLSVSNGCGADSICDSVAVLVPDTASFVPWLTTSTTAMSLYPNPNKGTFTVAFDGVRDVVRLQLFDATGRVVWQQARVATETVTTIHLPQLAGGQYVLHAVGQHSVHQQRVVLQH